MPETPLSMTENGFRQGKRVTSEEVMKHPRFTQALRQHVQLSLHFCSQYPLAREFFGHTARQVAFFYIAKLSARPDYGSDAPGLTRARLQDALRPWGLSQPGKLDALIRRLVDLELITKERLTDDRRALLIEPTEAFFELFNMIVAPHVLPSEFLIAPATLEPVAADQRSLPVRYQAFGAFHVENGLSIIQRVPEMLAFLRHASGWLILFVLMDALWRGDDDARKPGEVARFLGVSRQHVKNVFATSAELGLLVETEPGLWAPTEVTSKAVELWIAEALAQTVNFIANE
jgi:hypothetical protein